MPELPEVFTIAQTLDKNIRGFRIDEVTVNMGFKVRPSENTFLSILKDNRINKVSNYAKNIVFSLENGNYYLVVHPAMTGQLILKKTGQKPSVWERVLFTLSKNSKRVELAYNDMRMFGKLEVMSQKEYERLKLRYGLDPLNKGVTATSFHESIKKKRSSIKNVLLDQRIIAGVGNIYANDALFMAGINPRRMTSEIDLSESGKLLDKLREILNEGILHRGSTLDDEMFIDPFGKKGTHQNYFRIYGKKICPNCKSKVIFEKINGRGTYYCEICQK